MCRRKRSCLVLLMCMRICVQVRMGLVSQQDWAYLANLAMELPLHMILPAIQKWFSAKVEMLKAGSMVGPRVYSTGSILYGADGDFKVVVSNLDDALSNCDG